MSSTMQRGTRSKRAQNRSISSSPMRASWRQNGAFSRRESVGCDIKSVPDTGRRPHAIFKGWIAAQHIKVVAVLMAAVAVRDTRAVAIVRNEPREHRGKTELPFDLAQDQHAAIRRQLSTIKRCSDCFSADR